MGAAPTSQPGPGLFFRREAWGTDGAYDELLDDSGTPRAHWAPLFEGLARLGPSEFAERWEEARRQLRENGVTYNVYGDQRGTSRPWQLDPLPMLIPAAQWRVLEEGLTQRARLLDLILQDVYGPQTLLKDNLLPPEIVFANPGFLRPCYGMELPHNRWLHLYACDLARSPDGRWWILADRTQAPSGSGYALENRIVISRAFQQVFRDGQVRRLAGYFKALRQSLQALAPHHRESPRIVLLTPGPFNETYFEHSYLARYLGFTLVEGADLTVRENRVYLKTLEGLQPVDVILRRLDDTFCDPLELRGDSLLGVPGLVQAALAGNVRIANALGTGLVETPALKPFLGVLARRLLGEELKLPSVATWWCGQPDGLKYVLDHFDELVIKPAFPRGDRGTIFTDRLSAAARTSLVAKIQARPYDYVAQERVNLSAAPVWTEGRIEARHLTFRSHLVGAADGDYSVLPGGLTRVTSSLDTLVVSMREGGGSKDTWILSDEPVPPISLLPPPGEAIALRRAGRDLPSRVADNLFWLGRYTSRAEEVTRLLRAILLRITGESEPDSRPELPLLVETLRALLEGAIPAGGPSAPEELETYVTGAYFGHDGPAGLRGILDAVRHGVWTVRDRISVDAWRILNRLDQDLPLPDPDEETPWTEMLSFLDTMIVHLAAFSGMAMESMTRAHGWRFLEMGRRLERASATSTLLRCSLTRATEPEDPVLGAVLEVADSAMTYRSRYLNLLQFKPVLDLLLVDETNPRSVAFQMASLVDHVEHLPRDEQQSSRSVEQRLVLDLQTRVRLADVDVLGQLARGARRNKLDVFLKELSESFVALSDAVTQTYFSHSRPARQLNQSAEPRVERLTTYASPDSL